MLIKVIEPPTSGAPQPKVDLTQLQFFFTQLINLFFIACLPCLGVVQDTSIHGLMISLAQAHGQVKRCLDPPTSKQKLLTNSNCCHKIICKVG
jgi:hypothetical protein